MGKKRDHLERFMSKVLKDETSGCWLWKGRPAVDGYGRFRIARELPIMRAHKYALEQIKGVRLKDGEVIRHSCDTKLCVNPIHLEPGTHLQNITDRYRDGRRLKSKATRLADQIRHLVPHATETQIEQALAVLNLKREGPAVLVERKKKEPNQQASEPTSGTGPFFS